MRRRRRRFATSAAPGVERSARDDFRHWNDLPGTLEVYFFAGQIDAGLDSRQTVEDFVDPRRTRFASHAADG